MYEEIEDSQDDVIDYELVTEYAKNGLKNPIMIAHAMNLPVDWFTDTYKKKVSLAIQRGLSFIAMEAAIMIRKNARAGDFAAQKYLLQNVDDTWTDRKEVKNTNEIDIKGLPSLSELFRSGIEEDKKPKIVDNSDTIDGEFTEE